ncbi:MAG: hypothetical protein JWQ03_2762 [Variovorax sp.]|nr:hypothetical protein [Variovorax sp.]
MPTEPGEALGTGRDPVRRRHTLDTLIAAATPSS